MAETACLGLANKLKTSKFIYITCMSLDVANNVKQHNAMLQSVAAHNVRVPKRKVFKT